MKYQTLNLDSRYNVFLGICHIDLFIYQYAYDALADATNHQLLDKKKWLLLPLDDIIDKFFAALDPIGGTYKTLRGHFPVLSVCLRIMSSSFEFLIWVIGGVSLL